jgi:hypothetical protein
VGVTPPVEVRQVDALAEWRHWFACTSWLRRHPVAWRCQSAVSLSRDSISFDWHLVFRNSPCPKSFAPSPSVPQSSVLLLALHFVLNRAPHTIPFVHLIRTLKKLLSSKRVSCRLDRRLRWQWFAR